MLNITRKDVEAQDRYLDEEDIGVGFDIRRPSFSSNSIIDPIPALVDDRKHPGLDTTRLNGCSSKVFIAWTIVNTLATVGIVFTNKSIFNNQSFKNAQTSFAAFHFFCTSLTLYILSRPRVSMFLPKRCAIRQILPLAFAMCFNVVLPNFSLAYSSVTFYQVARILLTPCTAGINFMFYGITIPRPALLALFPICVGVGMVSYYDTLPAKGITSMTTTLGVIFAFLGVIASSLYTVWISSYHRKLEMSSMQLLFNQAPVSTLLLLCFVPFVDILPEFPKVEIAQWMLILMSGGFAALINLSQFFIVAGAGAVSSTVVGHAKTCTIVALGWFLGGREVGDKSLLGIVMAVGGIAGYSFVMTAGQRKA